MDGENKSKKFSDQCVDDNLVKNNNDNFQPNIIERNVDNKSVIASQPQEQEDISLMPSTSTSILPVSISSIDPTEFQSTSLYHPHHISPKCSSSPSSSKSSPASEEVNKFGGKQRTNKSKTKFSPVAGSSKKLPNINQQQKFKPQLAPESTPANPVLEIERINLDEDDHGQGRHNRGDSPNRSLNSSNDIDYLLSLLPPNQSNEAAPFEDPIQIRGNGNITLFGLSNCYTSTFPSALLGRVSREEFEYTINRINHLLQQQHSTNAKFLLLGCLCCCFSLGCSLLWPTFALSRRTKNSLEKLLAMENSRLYNRLGLNWRLSKQPSHTNHSFMEYILVIDFLPKIHIYQPD